jgi:alcohol dehydrogenase class IV
LFTFNSPTKIVFGEGSAAMAPKEMAAMGVGKVFIVTGKGRTASSEELGALKAGLEKEGLKHIHFAEAEADPSIGTVARGAALFKKEGCDSILAFGGGSPMDCAKGIGVSVAEGRPIEDFIGTGLAFTKALPPLVAIPTTAGTGSEVTNAAVFSMETAGQKAKKGTAGQTLFPRLALVDPLLQVSMPGSLTAATGMDALTHAAEAYLSSGANPVADMFCLESIRLIGANLMKAFEHGKDLKAREAMARASTLAGIALSQAGLGMVHGFAHAAGALGGLAHGLANAIILPFMMQSYVPVAESRLVAIGQALTGRSSISAGESAQAVAELGANLGIPPNLKTAGLEDALRDKVFDDAKGYKRRGQSPRLYTDDELYALFLRIWSGSLND